MICIAWLNNEYHDIKIPATYSNELKKNIAISWIKDHFNEAIQNE
jgi:hypothetical protein